MANKHHRWLKQILPPFLVKGLRWARRQLGWQPAAAVGSQQAAEWYDTVYRESDAYRRHYTQAPDYFLWCVVADRLQRLGTRRVLDLGCGAGQVAALLFDRGLPAYLGVDFSPQAIEQARQVCPGYAFRVADVMSSDVLASESYDTLLALEFLEHLENDLQVIEQLRPGVRLLASLPNFPYPSHVRHFSSAEAVRLRYQAYFDQFQVDVFTADAAGHQYFLIEAVRNEFKPGDSH